MDSRSYLETLRERFVHRFDVFDSGGAAETLGVDLLASYSLRGEKYIFSKKIKLYTQEEYEHSLVCVYRETVGMEEAREFARRVRDGMDLLVHPHPDHKRTILTGVMVAENGCGEDVRTFIRKYHSQKAFCFMMHGWCEVRLVLADLKEGSVAFCNKWHSRHLGKMYGIPAAL